MPVELAAIIAMATGLIAKGWTHSVVSSTVVYLLAKLVLSVIDVVPDIAEGPAFTLPWLTYLFGQLIGVWVLALFAHAVRRLVLWALRR
jgi:hypothetical protein